MSKEYTYEEFNNMPELVKYWAKKISEKDGRPAHPEDYVSCAIILINKAENDLPQKFKTAEEYTDKVYNEINRLFEIIIALRKHTPCHRDFCYSFLDWFDYVVGR